MAERYDWVEICEPRSGELMYANTRTGECLWDAPPAANVKKTSENQWWELYDENTRRYYYYNNHTKQTEWRKPKGSEIIALAKLQGKAAKRRSSSSRKDGKQRRRSSSSRKESGESQSNRDGDQSLPRKYSRQNSGESLSQLRKHSLRGSQSREGEGQSSKDDEEMISDTRREGETITRSSEEMREIPSKSSGEPARFTIGRDERDGGKSILDVPELNHSNRSSDTSMDLDTTIYPPDMDMTARNIEYLKISGEIADEPDILETSFLSELTASNEPSSGRTSNCSMNQSNYVSDGPLSESETSPLNDSFYSCDSRLGDSNSDEGLELTVTEATPPRETHEVLEPEDIPRTISFVNKMVDCKGNLLSPEEGSKKLQRHSSDRSNYGPPISIPVLRGERGGRRRSSSLGPRGYDNVSSPQSMYDNLNSDMSDDDDDHDEDTRSYSEKLIQGGMPSATAALVEDCEPMESPSIEERESSPRHYQHQISDSILVLPENGKVNRPQRPPPPVNMKVTKPLIARSNTCPVQNRTPTTPITPPPSQTQTFSELDFSVQPRGLFGKKDNLMNMLTHSKAPIKKPVLNTRDKQLKKEAVDVFKLILVYMGDKPNRSKQLADYVLWEIVTKAWSYQPLRDELYFQLVKQTTDNNSSSSLERGWELMAVCLAMFPPSSKHHSYLEGYVSNHLKDNQKPVNKILEQEISNRIAMYAENCLYKLEKMAKTGSRKGQRKPTHEEVYAAKKAIFHPSMFGSTLEDTIEMQRGKFPDRKLPWILTCLTEQIIQHNGTSTEGIFRVPGDIDEVNALKVKTDNWTFPDDCNDPNVAASLLKQWFRDLKEPLLDEEVYERCVSNCENETISNSIVASLPNINRLVLCFIIRFLQIFCKPEVIRVTKMDVNNLAMVWAPNFLRCPSNEPAVIFENTRKEMTFVRTLLNTFDTAFMEGVK